MSTSPGRVNDNNTKKQQLILFTEPLSTGQVSEAYHAEECMYTTPAVSTTKQTVSLSLRT